MRHKYNAKRTTYQGINFDSLAEAGRYQELALAEKAGEIADLKVHPTFTLQEAFTDNVGERHRAIAYEADFSYVDKATGRRVIEDVKGYDNRLWLLKKKMFLYRYRDLELRIVR